MEAAITSVIAVAGTLLGAVASYVFQQRTTRQSQRFARDERLWQERLSAYGAFSAAVTAYIESQNARWHRRREDSQSSAFQVARDAAYKDWASAASALGRLQLVSGREEVAQRAGAALETAGLLHQAEDEPDRAKRDAAAHQALHVYMKAASAHVSETNSG